MFFKKTTRSIAIALAIWPNLALSHPHIFVEATANLTLDENNTIKSIKHTWTFDEAFSAYATEGLDYNNNGQFDADELGDLAKVNVESLFDYAYFTFPGKSQTDQDKKDTAQNPSTWRKITKFFSKEKHPEGQSEATATFDMPTDYQLTYQNSKLTLEFVLNIPEDQRVSHAPLRDIAIFDPEFFVDYKFSGADAITLTGSKSQACVVAFEGYQELPQEVLNKIAAIPFDQRKLPEELVKYTQDLSNTITVNCAATIE